MGPLDLDNQHRQIVVQLTRGKRLDLFDQLLAEGGGGKRSKACESLRQPVLAEHLALRRFRFEEAVGVEDHPVSGLELTTTSL